MLAICLTAASPWPRKATHGCFHVFAWYRTQSDRHVLRRMLLKPKKNRTDYRRPGILTKKMKQFNEKSKVIILTYMHMISYEYENFGSVRTPVTKSSTRDRTESLFSFIQRTTSMCVSYEYGWKIQNYLVRTSRIKNTAVTRNTSSPTRTHTLWNKDAHEKKAPHAPVDLWLTCRRLAWFF